ncbi:MAG: hypothetical protein ACE367_13675 [Acidimicrobiales bacterium]
MKRDDDILRILDTAAAPLSLDEVTGVHRTGVDRPELESSLERLEKAAAGPAATARSPRRSYVAVVLVASAAAVVALLGVAVIGGDAGSGSDVVLVGAPDADLDPPSVGAQGSGAVDGMQPDAPEGEASEGATGQDSQAETDSPLAVDATIPWPDPVAVPVSPGTNAESDIIDLDAPGIAVLRIQGSGFGDGPGVLMLCGDVELHDSGGLQCGDTTVTTIVEEVASVDDIDVEIVAKFQPGGDAVVVVMPEAVDEPLLVATVRAPSPAQGPRLLPVAGQDGDAGTTLWIDRVSATTTVRGSGWEPGGAVTVHACRASNAGEIDRQQCQVISELPVDADGGVLGTVEVHGKGGERLAQGHEGGFLVAVQGEQIDWVPASEMPLTISVDALATIDLPAVVELTVRGLRDQERAEIRVCEQMQCAPPLTRATVEGSGSGEDVVEVEVPAAATALELVASDRFTVSYEFRIPGPPSSSGSATITVEPASVPAAGEYTFTISGEGWTTTPPVFLLPCAAEPFSTCDTGDLTPVTPVDGSFEAEVTYSVTDDGLVIGAGDAARSQTATAQVSIGP